MQLYMVLIIHVKFEIEIAPFLSSRDRFMTDRQTDDGEVTPIMLLLLCSRQKDRRLEQSKDKTISPS